MITESASKSHPRWTGDTIDLTPPPVRHQAATVGSGTDDPVLHFLRHSDDSSPYGYILYFALGSTASATRAIHGRHLILSEPDSLRPSGARDHHD